LALAANETLAVDTKPPAEAGLETIQDTDAKDGRRVGHSKTTMSLQKVLLKEEEKTSLPERHTNKEFQPVQATQGGVPRECELILNSFGTTESAPQ
jgi:hypothetical protein